MRHFAITLALALGLSGCGLLAGPTADEARDKLLSLAAKALVRAADGQDVDTRTSVCVDVPELSEGDQVYALCWARVVE